MAKQNKKDDSTVQLDKTEVQDGNTLKIRLESAKKAPPALVIVSGKPLGKSFVLVKDKMILGRELTADISIGETAISREHTAFEITEDGVLVRDMGSTNGTFLNDEKVNQEYLNDGDFVRCGNTIFKFLSEGKLENVFHEEMYNQANTDDLTGALNKKAITDLLGEEFERSKARKASLSLLLFDLDHFKKTNDNFGHQAGDYVLKQVCDIVMNRMIRQQDVLGRYGGEEFALMLRETPLEIAVEVAERIRSTIEKYQFIFEEKEIPVTMSIGVSTLDSSSATIDDLIKFADKALYEAKGQGRNQVCVR